MTTDETKLRSDLAAAIDRRAEEIEREWVRRVQEDLDCREVSPTDLRNAIGDYLHRIALALRGGDPMGPSGTYAWEEVAREHGVTRVRLGFDIDQLVREFILLRQVLAEMARDEGLDDRAETAALLSDLIEGAISVSVKSYVESRDLEARRREAEHVGFITHELRAPLGNASLALTQLRRTVALSPREVHSIDVVQRNLGRLGDLIDSVLTVERFEAEKVQARLTTMTLQEVLERALEGARAAAAAKGLSLEARFDPAVAVRVDPDLTRSALENVIGNAVKYTDEGHIDVSAEEIRDDLVIHVRDDGPGLSPQEIHDVFEPFHRGSSGKTGSGLGLAIARRAIEAQGGRIHAESKDGHGCHFWLTLPKASAPQHG